MNLICCSKIIKRLTVVLCKLLLNKLDLDLSTLKKIISPKSTKLNIFLNILLIFKEKFNFFKLIIYLNY